MPPRDLSKHSPLIKSQSLISIRRVRGREDGPEPEPAPAPVPSPPPSRERRNVQRTQSVPAQNKAARRLRKQSSAEHMAEPPAEDNLGSLVPHDAPVSPGSRHATLVLGARRTSALTGAAGAVGSWEDALVDVAAAQIDGAVAALRGGGGGGTGGPLRHPPAGEGNPGSGRQPNPPGCRAERPPSHPVLVPLQHGRLIEALRKEVAENREKLRLAEARAGETEVQQRGLRQEQGQYREQLERLRQQLEEANARAANLGAR